MTALSVEVYTEVMTNPEWHLGGQIEMHRLNPNISFDVTVAQNGLRTLSTHDTAPGIPITGFLYVPDLQHDDPCIEISAPYVPTNVTRLSTLPRIQGIKLVAIAPWVSPNCTLNYLAAARSEPIRGMIFFLPGNNTATPPPEDSGEWDLPLSSTEWKDQNMFPIYAISSASGAQYLNASAQYSLNMTYVPNGHYLTEYYDSRDYVRLVANIQTSSSDALPSLWIFLLVVLGIMVVIIILTSGIMHLLQRRRRNSLRRRVANGEVDLEALGIKRLTVPQEVLDQMPLYTYGSGEPAELNPSVRNNDSPDAVVEGKLDSPPSTRPSSPAPAPPPPTRRVRGSTSHRPTTLQQPTCAICLDDFVSASGGTQGTIVRELPCQHIFHPECVDTFLRDSSSLCPMCKKTALPIGYCPRVITNAMVRRERMVRRIRPRAESTVEEGNGGERTRRSTFGLNRLSSWNERRTTAASTAQRTPQDTEMTPVPPAAREVSSQESEAVAIEPRVQPPSNPRRREWARQRAVAMLGGREAPVDPDAEEVRSMPRWRKALMGIFPAVAR